MDFPTQSGPGRSILLNVLTAATSATSNTKGAFAEIVASTSQDFDSLIVHIGSFANYNALWDIAVGGSGAEVVVVPNLLVGGYASMTFTLPLQVPAGSRISTRGAAAGGTTSAYVTVIGVTGGLWGAPSGGYIDDLGTTLASSRGILLDAGATINTYPGWTTIKASTTRDIAALALIVQGNANAGPTSTLWRLQVGVGAASSEVILHETSFIVSTLASMTPHAFWLPSDIPAGSRVAARVRSSTNDATDRVINFNLYGLVV